MTRSIACWTAGLLTIGTLEAAGRLDADLPSYRPQAVVEGAINSIGDDAMEPLLDSWLAAFQKRQPGIAKGPQWEHLTNSKAIAALAFEITDVAPIAREPWPTELGPYERLRSGDGAKEPLLIRVGSGSYAPPGKAGAIGVHVHASNPLQKISFTQLDAIFGRERRRGSRAEIRTWGQLGLTGAWADRPIVPVSLQFDTGLSQMVQRRVLKLGPWQSCVLEIPGFNLQDLLKKIAENPGAIGLGGFVEAPRVRTVPLGETDAGPFIQASPETVAGHAYPFSRYIYIAVNRRAGAPLAPKVREFLSFILSREGQEIVANFEHFFALSARDAAGELSKLEGLYAAPDPGIPSYRASARVSGSISSVGFPAMKLLMDSWMKEFRGYQPDVHKGEVWEHVGNSLAMPALYSGVADIAPMGREVLPYEMVPYEKRWKAKRPLEIRVARGARSLGPKSPAQVIYVHAENPLARISKPQLDAILGSERRLGYHEEIARWGQLGLKGEWETRPMTVYMPSRTQASAVYVRKAALRDGPWKCGVVEGSNVETMKAIARDRTAIGFGSQEDRIAGTKVLAVSETEGAEAFDASAENIAAGRYPFSPFVYVEVNRNPGEPLAAHIREFLRFILSQEGQRLVSLDAFYPLSPAEVKAELAKLE